jgi:dipeptidyl aminopeptidase/acylaminoacyl peptidase
MVKMMKRIVTIVMALMPMVTISSATIDGFEEAYNKTSFADYYNRYIDNNMQAPVWDGTDRFLYSIRVDNKEQVYAVDIKAATQTLVDNDSINRLGRQAANTNQGFGNYWGGQQRRNMSPDGKWELYIRDFNVWIKESSSTKEYQLSFDGAERAGYGQVRWSPDSRTIFAMKQYEVDTRQILLAESRPTNQTQPNYRWIDYAKPGDALAQNIPVLFNVETKKQVPFDASSFNNQYSLYFSAWSPDSKYAIFHYNQRGHQVYQIVAINTVTGEHRALVDERSNTFIYYNDIVTRYLDGGNRLLFTSERDNWRHLYTVDIATGNVKQITKGKWNVREILHLDEEQGIILCYANGLKAKEERGNVAPGTVSAAGKKGKPQGEDPYNKHLIKVEIATGKVTDLTPENGHHTVYFNGNYSYFVDNYSRPDMAPVALLKESGNGKVVLPLQTAKLDRLLETGYTLPEVFVAKGRDGKTDIWGTIHRPSNFDPTKKYPVIEYIYAGPHDSFVDKNFVIRNRFDRLKEMGFIVVYIDGMGTDNRSKEFQDVCWRNLKDAGFPDRILWMKAAASVYPEMDIDKVGIYGYSAGGQSAMGALLFYPEFYKVAVALCGCHDNRMDKIWWNEQWMGYPIGPWYGESSNVDNAHKLQGDLLLINGELDDNVDPASTLQVVSELVKHNKQFEQLYLPGHNHNLGSEYITRRIYEFFYRKCRN